MGDIKKVGRFLGKAYGGTAGFILGGPAGAKVGYDVGSGKSLKDSVRGLAGHTEQIDNVPADVKALRESLIQTVMAGLPGFANASFGYGQGAQGFSALDPSIVKPYADLFTATRADALGQAKESAGNLTGTGYANILGDSAARSLAEEQATLAGLGIQNQQFQQQRNEQFLRLLLGLTMDKAQVGYQPGFLDYLFQGAGMAAPLIARR